MSIHRSTRRFLCALVCLLAFAGTAAAQVPHYDSFYTFGDSLADTGNIFAGTTFLRFDPPVPPSEHPHQTYFHGRFSNGPVAFEYLWELLSGNPPGSPGGLKPFTTAPILGRTGAVDFSFGGTGTPFLDQTPGGFFAPGLKGQIELFRAGLRGRRPSRHALYAIVTGANDYRDDPFNVPMSPVEVVANIADGIRTLYTLGARDIMVLGLPDLGALPGGTPEGSALTALHNQLLANALSALAVLPGIRLIPVDINGAFVLLPPAMDKTTPALDVFYPPVLFPPGFMMSLCLFINPATCLDVPTFDTGSQFLFWDAVHPTTAAHRVLAKHLFNSLPN